MQIKRIRQWHALDSTPNCNLKVCKAVFLFQKSEVNVNTNKQILSSQNSVTSKDEIVFTFDGYVAKKLGGSSETIMYQYIYGISDNEWVTVSMSQWLDMFSWCDEAEVLKIIKKLVRRGFLLFNRTQGGFKVTGKMKLRLELGDFGLYCWREVA